MKKSAQIEGLSLHLTCFGASFHLNETARFGKNGVVSYIFFLKKSKNGVVLNGTICFLLPLDTERTREEEDFSPLLCALPLFSKPPKRRRQNSPLACHMVEEKGMHPFGSSGAAAQWPPRPPYPFGRGSRGLPPSSFTYKYKGGQKQERKKRGKEHNRRGKELKTERKKKRKTKKKKKTQRSRGEKRERPLPGAATASITATS